MKKILHIFLALVLSTSCMISTFTCCDCTSSLSSFLKIKDLSELYIGFETLPFENTIKQAIKTSNPEVDTTAINISNITNTTAIVEGNGKKYIGKINVNFTTKHYKNITPNFSQDVNSLTCTPDGTVYAGLGNTQVWKIDKNNNVKAFARQIFGVPTAAIVSNPKNEIYLGDDGEHLWKIDKKDNVKKITPSSQENIISLSCSNNGIIYAGTRTQIFKISNNESTIETIGVGVINSPVNNLTTRTDGVTFAVLANGELYKIDINKNMKKISSPSSIDFLTSRDNTVYLIDINDGIYKLDTNDTITNIPVVINTTSINNFISTNKNLYFSAINNINNEITLYKIDNKNNIISMSLPFIDKTWKIKLTANADDTLYIGSNSNGLGGGRIYRINQQ